MKSNTHNAPAALALPEPLTTEDSWLRLAEYGSHPHPGGLQCLTPEAAQRIVRNFRSFFERCRRRFSGLPVFIGHPDDPTLAGSPGHDDTRAYGWIFDLEARPDGLWIFIRWSEAGRHLLKNAFYKFLSPRWVLQPLGGAPAGHLSPLRLVSVGLTNHPNIPGDVIANASPKSNKKINTLKLKSSDETKTMTTDNDPAQLKTLNDQLQEQSERFSRLAFETQQAHDATTRRLDETLELLANERRERIALAIEKASREGRIAPVDIPAWQQRLEEDLTATLPQLTNTAPVLHTRNEALSNGLLPCPPEEALPVSRRSRIRREMISAVLGHMAATGASYTAAWSHVQKNSTGKTAA